jgi:hypothetical protein
MFIIIVGGCNGNNDRPAFNQINKTARTPGTPRKYKRTLRSGVLAVLSDQNNSFTPN